MVAVGVAAAADDPVALDDSQPMAVEEEPAEEEEEQEEGGFSVPEYDGGGFGDSQMTMVDESQPEEDDAATDVDSPLDSERAAGCGGRGGTGGGGGGRGRRR